MAKSLIYLFAPLLVLSYLSSCNTNKSSKDCPQKLELSDLDTLLILSGPKRVNWLLNNGFKKDDSISIYLGGASKSSFGRCASNSEYEETISYVIDDSFPQAVDTIILTNQLFYSTIDKQQFFKLSNKFEKLKFIGTNNIDGQEQQIYQDSTKKTLYSTWISSFKNIQFFEVGITTYVNTPTLHFENFIPDKSSLNIPKSKRKKTQENKEEDEKPEIIFGNPEKEKIRFK